MSTIFDINRSDWKLWDYPGNVHVVITYELDRDLRTIQRKVYGILDFLGDIGGLSGAMKALFALSIGIFMYRAPISYVSNHLYLIRDGDEISRDKRSLVN